MNFDFDTSTLTPSSSVLTISSTGALQFPTGTTAQAPTATAGRVRWNTDSSRLETADGTSWSSLAVSATTLAGYGITDAQQLNTNLTGIAGVATTGVIVRTGSGTFSSRTIQGTSGTIVITDGDGVAGNPTINLASAGTPGTYATVTTDIHGRVTSGVTTQSAATGGTGLTAIGTSNQLLGVNAGATALEYKTLSAGTGITITNSAGAVSAALATIASNTVLGNTTAGTAAPAALTQTQLTTLVNTFTASLSGAAPASGGGTENFLRADGTWAAPAGGGVSISSTENQIAIVNGGRIATLGTITGGSGYLPSSGARLYSNVLLSGGTGVGAQANITVTNGQVTALTPTYSGYGYTAGDVLTAFNGELGGSGSGFSVPVATVLAAPSSATIATNPRLTGTPRVVGVSGGNSIIAFSDNGIGTVSGFNLARTNDVAGIHVAQTGSDAIKFQVYIGDNAFQSRSPGAISFTEDHFAVDFSNWLGPHSNWSPVTIANQNIRTVGARFTHYGQMHIRSEPFFTGNGATVPGTTAPEQVIKINAVPGVLSITGGALANDITLDVSGYTGTVTVDIIIRLVSATQFDWYVNSERFTDWTGTPSGTSFEGRQGDGVTAGSVTFTPGTPVTLSAFSTSRNSAFTGITVTVSNAATLTAGKTWGCEVFPTAPVAITGVRSNTMLHVGRNTTMADTSGAPATVHIERDFITSNDDGLRVYFNSGSPAGSAWVRASHDGAVPLINLTDADDDAPYITFNTIGTGTMAAPLYVSAFGARGPAGSRTAGNESGFAWHIGTNQSARTLIDADTAAMELDQQWLRIPRGTAAQRPTVPEVGMIRYNSHLATTEMYDALSGWSSINTSPSENNVLQFVALLGQAGTTAIGSSTATTAGTTTAAGVAATPVNTAQGRAKRTEFLVTTAAANAIASWRVAQNMVTVGAAVAGYGGFKTVMRAGPATGVAVATHRFFMGFAGSTAAPTDVEPSAQVNIVGVGYDSADTQLQIMHNDAAGIATKVALGASFPKPNADRTNLYRFRAYSPSGLTQSVNWEVTNLTNGARATGTISTDIPAATLALSPRMYTSTGTATASVIGLCFADFYLEWA